MDLDPIPPGAEGDPEYMRVRAIFADVGRRIEADAAIRRVCADDRDAPGEAAGLAHVRAEGNA